jgi:hypothetical protein
MQLLGVDRYKKVGEMILYLDICRQLFNYTTLRNINDVSCLTRLWPLCFSLLLFRLYYQLLLHYFFDLQDFETNCRLGLVFSTACWSLWFGM